MKIKTSLNDVPKDAKIVRVAQIDKHNVEYDYVTDYDGSIADINDFRYRTRENIDKFTAVMIIPTGIGCEIGGHAGDAGAVARLIGSACDTLILHPNVVNASDINEMPQNALYVEGSTVTRLLQGMVGLDRVRANRVLFIVDADIASDEYQMCVNIANAARASYGIDIVDVVATGATTIRAELGITDGGRAGAILEGVESIPDLYDGYKSMCDAVALATVMPVNEQFGQYFNDLVNINPWGGAEAMLTHTMSLMYDIPFAHAPIEGWGKKIVDPRKAAEAIPTTHINCILKGLMRSPRINTEGWAPADITTEDISCLIIPDGCAGPPIDAAIRQRIPIIAVRENANIMRNDLASFNYDKMYFAENYLEAVGIMNLLKEGLTYESVRRPIPIHGG